jgi:hypothetical protein
MRKKIIGILICTLLIATAIPAVGSLTIEKNNPARNSLNDNYDKSQESQKIINTMNQGAIFSQKPVTPDKTWNGFFSDIDQDFRSYENFWNVTNPICDIHWWGFGAIWNGSHWNECDPTNMVFDITFYNDDGSGKPGDVVCSYKDISPKIRSTGVEYEMLSAGPLKLYYFEYDLDPCCQLSNGWVSVFKVSNPNECIFAWMVSNDGDKQFWSQNISANMWITNAWDLAFILTDGDPINTKLECFGSLSWDDVVPGDNVAGMFQIRNNGESGSVIHWEIESYPTWSTNWTFNPDHGLLTTEMDWINVYVNVTAPLKKNKKETGTVKVVNIMDSDDFCEIDVKLKTPKNKPYQKYSEFQRFLESHPNLFPIIRQVLGL